jgi:two-component system chemotaxis sensor kinase CheA
MVGLKQETLTLRSGWRFPIALKLLFLAGVPVIGALLLALLLAQQAQERARSAEALGTVEDLATLCGRMSAVIHGVQDERTATSLMLATTDARYRNLKQSRAGTDASLAELEAFLSKRNLTSLPPRLARDLARARTRLRELPAFRQRVDGGTTNLLEATPIYTDAAAALISATAALTQLSDEGDLLRTITMLVNTLEVSERASREEGLLGHVFTVGRFPPGTYKELVTLVSEDQLYTVVLSAHATDEQSRQFAALTGSPSFAATAKMRKAALETDSEEDFGVTTSDWLSAQSSKLDGLRKLEGALAERMRELARGKLIATTTAIQTSLGVSGAVLVLSALLAVVIGRGISRSVQALAKAANRVRANADFSIRAVRCSSDELGMLTEAFNQMLSNIQERDSELEQHRSNLESLVRARTTELARRNTEMRVVLDAVEQGLAVIDRDGNLGTERSRAFTQWFGEAREKDVFYDVLCPQDHNSREILRASWDALIEDVLPLELTIDQMPKRLLVGERTYALHYRPIFENETLHKLLLIVSDITDELERLKQDAIQREFIGVFEKVMKDKSGFIEFFNEASSLADELLSETPEDDTVLLRKIHTLKGNAALFGITSVAEMCHGLETLKAEEGIAALRASLPGLARAWSNFAHRVVPLIGTEADDVIEVHCHEFDRLTRAIRAEQPHGEILHMLNRLRFEPTSVRFQRAGEQAKQLARRIGRAPIDVHIDDGDVRLPAERWNPFWNAFVHVVRNCVDHGIESTEERLRQGKSEHGQLRFRSRQEGGNFVLTVEDDGRGIDWGKVKAKAQSLGLAAATQRDLEASLFAEGLSTKDSVTDVSGRGVGMGAILDVTLSLGGRVGVQSRQGEGTAFVFTIPVDGNDSIPKESQFPGARPSVRPFPSSR